MRFRLITIAYVFALLAAGLATFGGVLGFLATFLVLLFWAGFGRKLTLTELLVVIAIVGVLIGLTVPTDVGSSREHIRVAACENHLSLLAKAVPVHQEKTGRLPSPATSDGNGAPSRSWRVEMLPYLDHGSILSAYRPDEHWNSETNSRATDVDIDCFCCPSDSPSTPHAHQTNYFAVIGKQTIWAEKMQSPGAATDDPDETILLIEAAGKDVPWAKPSDLRFDDAMAILTGRDTSSVVHVRTPPDRSLSATGGEANGGVNVAFASGRTAFIPVPISAELARALLTANGGEKIAEILGSRGYRWAMPAPIRFRYYPLAVFVFLAVLPAYQLVWRRKGDGYTSGNAPAGR